MADKLVDKNFREILASQIVSVLGGVIAGIILASYTNKILIIPGMLITLPAFLDMRGNISGSLASRLSSGLFLGVVNPRKMHTRLVRGNVWASFILAAILSLALGLVSFLFNNFVMHSYYPAIIFIFLIAGLIANLIEIPITIYLTFYLFRKGHDPNNILGPFVTSTGDITSVLSILMALLII